MNFHEMIFGRRFTMKSPHSREQCAKRLKAEVENYWTFLSKKSLTENGPWVGKIEENAIYVSPRTVTAGLLHNYQTTIRAKLVDEGSGTKLECRTSMSGAAKFTLSITLGSFCYLLATLVLAPSQTHNPSDTNAVFAAICGGLAIVVFGRFLARHDEQELVEFLETTIGAKRV